MVTKKNLISLTTAIFLSLPLLAFGEHTKIDPGLHLLSQKGAHSAVAVSHGILKSAAGSAEPLVSTIVRFQGSLTGVKALGGQVRSVMGDVATVDMPLSAVAKVSELQSIIHVEASRNLKHRLDTSVPATGANTLRSGNPPNWTGKTGKGVVIGIIDTGIDLNHKDFRTAAGKTRILSLWDQTANGTHPAGYSTGNECTQAIIDAGGCSEADTDGHGTHVAGIAAGNGAATGNGAAAYRFIGMAPEADLIVVKIDWINTASVLDAIAYIQSKAAALGKPSVVNLSFGSHDGPHDGTSSYERGLDNLSGVGKVIVAAAGNEAEANIHASGNVYQGGNTTVGFSIPAGYGNSLDIWYPGASQFGVSVSNGKCTTPVVYPGNTHTFQTSCGRIDISSSEVNPNNGDREIVIQMSNGTSSLSSGAWNFTLYGNSVVNGRFDAWSSDEVATFTSNIDPSITLNDGATSTKTIAVAAYTTKNTWQSIDGNTYHYSDYPQLDAIASFSSHGPRRACSDTAKCPSIQKPEIAAPGMGIMSALSTQVTGLDQAWIDPDGVHVLTQGTSMAAPHVAGAVALILQSYPTLTSDQIKGMLTSTAKTDNFTAGIPQFTSGMSGFIDTAGDIYGPNNIWGYGKLDVAAVYPSFSDTTPDPISFTSLTGVALNSLVLSNTVTMHGVGIAPISITGGEFSVNGGAYTSDVRYITNGQTLKVRLTSANAYMTTTTATVTVGGISAIFRVTTQAQEFTAVNSKVIGGTGYEQGNAIALDQAGNLYVTGFFSSTTDFDPGIGVDLHVPVGSQDIFITKINADGSYGWARTMGGPVWDYGYSVKADNHGHVYIAGSFIGTVDFDPGAGSDIHTAVGSSDIFLTQFNVDGTYGWTKTWGNISGDAANSIAIDGSGNIYITGYFDGAINFNSDGGLDNHISEGFSDIFLTKINSNGTYGWTKTMGGIEDDSASSIAVDSGGNLYLTGSYRASVDFDPGIGSDVRETYGYPWNTSADVFLTKINSDGSYGWTRTWGGDFYDTGNSIGVDRYGNVYVAGSFSSQEVDFPPFGADNHVSLRGAVDVFLTKIGVNGESLWTRTFGGESADNGNSVTVDFSGNVYVLGHFSGAVDFDDSVGADIHISSGTAPLDSNIFLTRINTNGTYGWTKTFGGANLHYAYGTAVAIGNNENLYLTGSFSGAINFDSKSGSFTSNGGDVFITQLEPLCDKTPAVFTFIKVNGVDVNSLVSSNAITVQGIDCLTPVIITGGEYSINDGTWTSVAGTVTNGQTVTVRLSSSGSYSTITSATLTIGGVSGTFSVTTQPVPDTTPDAFSFTSRILVYPALVIASETVTVSGINTATPVSISGGEYRIGNGIWTNAGGTITNGQTVTVRLSSPGTYNTSATAMLTIGGISAGYSVTTVASDKHILHTPWVTSAPKYFSYIVFKNTSNSTLQIAPTVANYNGDSYTDPSLLSLAPGKATFLFVNNYSSKINDNVNGALQAAHTGNPGDLLAETIIYGPNGANFSIPLRDNSAVSTTLNTPWVTSAPKYYSYIVFTNTSRNTVQITPTIVNYNGDTYTDPSPLSIAPGKAAFLFVNNYSGNVNGNVNGALQATHTGNPGDLLAQTIIYGPNGTNFTFPMKDNSAASNTLHTPWVTSAPQYYSYIVLKNTSSNTMQVTPTVANYNGDTYTDAPLSLAPGKATFIFVNNYSSNLNGNLNGALHATHTGNPGDLTAQTIIMGPNSANFSIPLRDNSAASTTLNTPWVTSATGYNSYIVLTNTSNTTMQVTPTIVNYTGDTYTDAPLAVAPGKATFLFVNNFTSKLNGNINGAVQVTHTGNPGDLIAQTIIMGPNGVNFTFPMR